MSSHFLPGEALAVTKKDRLTPPSGSWRCQPPFSFPASISPPQLPPRRARSRFIKRQSPLSPGPATRPPNRPALSRSARSSVAVPLPFATGLASASLGPCAPAIHWGLRHRGDSQDTLPLTSCSSVLLRKSYFLRLTSYFFLPGILLLTSCLFSLTSYLLLLTSFFWSLTSFLLLLTSCFLLLIHLWLSMF
jgi:hypothetical protein